MYYDKMGRRVPAPRHDKVPSDGMVAVVCMLIILAIGAIVWGVSRYYPKHEVGLEPMAYINARPSGAIRLYVITDPDTGKEYIVSDRGGVCLRESANALE